MDEKEAEQIRLFFLSNGKIIYSTKIVKQSIILAMTVDKES
ncbi:hypothetical protein [Brevibacillus fortis]|nr:hypothetical protein [Brevibacillus fortis]